MISGHPISTSFRRLTGCQWDPRDRGVTENMHVNTEAWTHANKVCRHTILTILSNELFDVCCAYKEVNVI